MSTRCYRQVVILMVALLLGFAPFCASATGGTPHSPYPMRITSANGGGCIDAPLPQPPSAASGDVWFLQQFVCNGGDNEHWSFESKESGKVIIHSALSPGFCFDLSQGATSPKTHIQLYPCHGGPNQQFVIRPVNDGTAEISPALAPDEVIDVENGTSNAQAAIQLFPRQNSANQHWRFSVDGLPQGLTGGIAHVNHDCAPSAAAFLAAGAAAIGLIGCAPPLGGNWASCAAAIQGLSGIIAAAPGTSFLTCSEPSVFRSGAVLSPGAVDPVPTLHLNAGHTAFTVQAAPGWITMSDGDIGNSANFGFYHQELGAGSSVVFDDTVADRFVLPKGAVCGFHHSRNTPFDIMQRFSLGNASTCMGQDPAIRRCPVGWIPKNHFDMSSGDGQASCVDLNSARSHCAYFVWCEYQDPNGLCDADVNCLSNVRRRGFGLSVASDTDAAGAATLIQIPPVNDALCPIGWIRTNAYDDGRSAGQGLSWCHPLTDDLPQGLTAGMIYALETPQFGLQAVSGGVALGSNTLQANGDGFLVRSDGDYGASTGSGFYHQELASGGVVDPALSDRLKLLPGAACGFHHTRNTPGRTCMGLDPVSACPNGWLTRRHFDMSSNTGYFVWCEYQDPRGLCSGQASGQAVTECEAKASFIGYAVSINSNTDRGGTAIANGGSCQSWTRSPYFDVGRPAGKGISWCMP